jgi:hypothetical protein
MSGVARRIIESSCGIVKESCGGYGPCVRFEHADRVIRLTLLPQSPLAHFAGRAGCGGGRSWSGEMLQRRGSRGRHGARRAIRGPVPCARAAGGAAIHGRGGCGSGGHACGARNAARSRHAHARVGAHMRHEEHRARARAWHPAVLRRSCTARKFARRCLLLFSTICNTRRTWPAGPGG